VPSPPRIHDGGERLNQQLAPRPLRRLNQKGLINILQTTTQLHEVFHGFQFRAKPNRSAS
jgi:hypothetical protein